MNNQFIIAQFFRFNKREFTSKKAAIRLDSGFLLGWISDGHDGDHGRRRGDHPHGGEQRG